MYKIVNRMNLMSNNKCPKCGRQMFFGGNGRSLQCDVCGYKQAIKKEIPPPDEIVKSLKFMAQFNNTREDDAGSQGVRILMAQGVTAAKEGNKDEAYYHLEWVLRADSTDDERSEAWVWLSQIYEDEAHKRICLEQALAHQPMNPVARRGLAVIDGRLQANEIIDPNQAQKQADPEAQPREVKSEQFQCPRCAARMNYTPDGKALLCEFCSYRQELDVPEAHVQSEYGIGGLEKDFIAALATAKGHSQPVAMRSMQCMGCAIEFVLAPETLSITCPYCDSVYVTETAETHDILPPQALIPFTISENDVKLAMRAWFKQHKIERPRVSPIVGMYLPLWTFDIGGEIRWKGQKQQGDKWVPVSGSKYIFYDDVLVPATKRLPKTLMKEVYHYDYAQLVEYDARYLADWPAERYQLTLADASLGGRKQIISGIRRKPHQVTYGEYIRDFSVSSNGIIVESYKLILVPLWMLHFKVEDTVYDVIINGQTGNIRGERPQNVVGKLFSWLKGD
jgi:DNA-directed RNA polymerase subunit RPC12/RpoP